MNVAGETEILLEVNGKQFESRLIVQNPDGTGAGNGTVVTDSSLQETDTDTAPNPERDTLQPAGAAGDKQYD